MVLLTLGLLIASVVPLAAGQEERAAGFLWTRQFGTPGGDDGRGVAVDATGVYVAGFTLGALPNQTSAGGMDAFLRKYDLDGRELWTRQFGSLATDAAFGVTIDASGVYVVGETQGALPNQTAAGGTDAFVRKYDTDGNHVWTRQFGTPSEDIPYAGAADATGVYVVGMTGGVLPNQTSAGGADGFVRKYDQDGNELWTRQFGIAGDEWAFGIAAGPSGVYVAGEVRGPNETGVWNVDAFVRKYSGNGTHLWTERFGTPGEDRGIAVAVDSSAVYIAGLADNGDAFLQKRNLDGDLLWTDSFGTAAFEGAKAVAVYASRIYLAGSTTGSLARENADGDADAFLRRYNPEGAALWTLQFGSSAAEDGASGVAAGPLGVYVTGHTFGFLLGGARAGDEADAYVVRTAETPDPPADPGARAGDGEAVLAWGPSPFDGGQPVDSYAIYRGENSSALSLIAVVDGASRNFTDRTVRNNVTYFYRFAARNQIGEGPWSDLVQATPRAPPLLLILTPREVLTNDPNVVIEGRTEADATVEINGQDIPVDVDGTFRWSSTLPDGCHEFLIVARNPIGLESSAIVTITVDTRTPLLLLLGLGAIAVFGGAVLFAGFRRWTRRAK